ncbi:MAG TPA: (2Fe-2S) ferredoxin domain-containing protein [Usitatibacteraceae bacterium]|jgi:(2Fe-2S) ferredoxin|nr:ferredoxin [Verrucomicrobiales bacterium]HRE13297.1 (2Fe-2S) ferredoxin domain-containing protein [Usitatibacteraceae bacterium]
MGHYQHHVFFCDNVRDEADRACCGRHDASAMRDHCKSLVKAKGLSGPGKVRVNKAGCLDRCEEGPCLVVYPEGTWYTYVDKSDIEEIVEEHLVNGRVVERLVI